MNKHLPTSQFAQRARPAHPPPYERHNGPIIIFLTVCTKNRRPILANDKMHSLIRAAWTEATHWLVGRYLIMPDHIHLFCTPAFIDIRSLDNWVGFWKGGVCELVDAPAGDLWLRDFWDTQLRNAADYAAKWEYVRNNPVRAGLVTRPEDWPYQGELNEIRWCA